MADAVFLNLSGSKSPRFIGWVIAALGKDQEMARKLNGKVSDAADLAREPKIKDSDGGSRAPLTIASS